MTKLVVLLMVALLVVLLPATVQADGGTGQTWVVIYHTVRPGDTWHSIASKYGASAIQIANLNGNRTLVAGQSVKVAVRAAVPRAANAAKYSSPVYPLRYTPHIYHR